MSKKQKAKAQKNVLEDYKRVGSTFIPPMTHKIGPMTNISYSRQTMPELIWWNVVSKEASPQFAISLADAIGTYFKQRDELNCWWAFISDYSKLAETDFQGLCKHLDEKKLLHTLSKALSKFLALYPRCPLIGFLGGAQVEPVDSSYLEAFEKQMIELEYKRSRLSVLMQAQAVYLGFVLEKLFVNRGLALDDFPEVSNYPNTERSKEVGASICAAVNMTASQMLPPYKEDTWVLYFWDRNLQLRPLDFNHLEAR